MKALQTEKDGIYESLAHSSEEMEKKQEMITQLKEEGGRIRPARETVKGTAGKSAERKRKQKLPA